MEASATSCATYILHTCTCRGSCSGMAYLLSGVEPLSKLRNRLEPLLWNFAHTISQRPKINTLTTPRFLFLITTQFSITKPPKCLRKSQTSRRYRIDSEVRYNQFQLTIRRLVHRDLPARGCQVYVTRQLNNEYLFAHLYWI